MAKPRDERQKDLFRPPLDRIIDLGHPLVRLAGEIDWGFLERRISAVCSAGPGQPARLVAGLFILQARIRSTRCDRSFVPNARSAIAS